MKAANEEGKSVYLRYAEMKNSSLKMEEF